MNATISNKQHPDWGCATIPLPIPDEEYAHCMELLEQLQIGGVTERDCHLDRLDRSPAALDVLEGQEVNINELGYIGYIGAMSLEELMMEDPAEAYQQEQKEEQGQTMGGMM